MARESYLVLNCSLYSESIAEVISAFNKIGWGFAEKKEYLPLHDNDDFDWQSGLLSAEEVLSLISQKQALGELCGVILYHKVSGRGISLLAKSTDDIMLNISINRKILCDDFTDISWYIENIAAKLESIGCTVGALEYSEIIG